MLDSNSFNLPPALTPLKSERRWVNWRLETRKGKETKPPYQPNGLPAHNDDDKTWSPFDAVVKVSNRVGYMLMNGTVAAFDIDKCRDPTTGQIHPWAQGLIDKAASYTEITPSGTGLRIIGFADGEHLHRKLQVADGVSCELYRKAKRYITVSGDVLYDRPLADIDALLDATLAELDGKPEPEPGGDERDLPKSLAALLHVKDFGGYDSRSELLFAFVTGALRAGVAKITIVKACTDTAYIGNSIFEHVRENGGPKYIERQIERAQEKIADNASTRAEQRLTELGNARRLVKRYGKDLRFVHAWNAWVIWREGHWRRDEDGAIVRLAKATVEAMLQEAFNVNDDKREAMIKFALNSQKAAQLRNMVALAESEAEIVLPPEKWDADPMLLGVQNGVIDLRTGSFREARREDFITKRAGTIYDARAKCPNWDEFVSLIFDKDEDFIAYVHRCLGYILTGLTVEEILFLQWGTGSNGKTTFRETHIKLMGDYAIAVDPSLLVAQDNKQSGAATPELAQLPGRRLVTINETKDRDFLNESRVKAITSTDKIPARALYEKPFDFVPTHKTVVSTNHKPIVRGTDEGIWRRLSLWPFKVKIQNEDKHFREKKLTPELPGILNRMLEGLKDYQRVGLNPPKCVRDATNEYRKDMDLIGRWIDERCTRDFFSAVETLTLYDSYKRWAEDNVGFTISVIAFGRDLSDRGFERVLVNRNRGFKGLKVATISNNEPSPPQFETVGPAPDAAAVCEHCNKGASRLMGDVFLIRNPRRGNIPYVLHQPCAAEFFDMND
jgi:putative DNA primase/helicase